jgi:hypothetical protein
VPAPTPITAAYPSIPALCEAFLREAEASRAHREESARALEATLGPFSCAEAPANVRFRGDATYLRVRAVRESDGIATYTILVLETPRGLVPTPIDWEIVDVTDPGCPSIARPAFVEAAWIESGHFVATVASERTTYVETTAEGDSGSRGMLGLDVVWCKETGGALVCRTHDGASMGGDPIGWKVQPSEKSIAWSRLAWTDRVPFAITPDGEIRLDRKE